MRTAKQTARIFGLSAVQVKTCANCGKQFPIVSPDYAYKIERRQGGKYYSWFCSYACMRMIQRPLEAKRKEQFEAKVKKDILVSLEESEKHSQRMLAAYHAKKAAKARQKEDGGQKPVACTPPKKETSETKLTAKERETIEDGEQDAQGRRRAKEEAKGKQEAMSGRELIMTGILALALAVVVALRTAAR